MNSSTAGVKVLCEAPSGGVTWTPEDEARLDAAITRRAAARACPICGPNIPLPGERCTREHGCAIAGVLASPNDQGENRG